MKPKQYTSDSSIPKQKPILNKKYNLATKLGFKLICDIVNLKNGIDVKIPQYKVNGTGISVPNAIEKKSADINIVEGICVLYDKVHDLFDIKIYIDVDEDIRKERYISRAQQRNQSIEEVKEQWEIVNKSAIKYIRPTKKHADIVINGSINIKQLKNFASDLLSTVASFKRQQTSKIFNSEFAIK